jgi:hypothetical protein
MDDRLTAFIDSYPDAAMITHRADGSSHVVRIEVAVVDGCLWSSGAPDLLRTRHLRRDSRCSLFVFGPHPKWVGLETDVTMLEGPESPQRHIRLMQARHGESNPDGMVLGHDDELGYDRPYPVDEYAEHVRAENRLIYQFEIRRMYGYF